MSEHREKRSPEEIEADIALKREELLQKQAETRKTLAEARKAEAEAEAFDMDLVTKKELRAVTEAHDRFHHLYQFIGTVDAKSVEHCIDTLTAWSRMEPGCDIEVVFNSPGGDVIAGMALFDFLMQLQDNGHKLTTTAFGYAASMAGILLQAGSHRRMGKEAWVLIHEGSFGAQGTAAAVEDRVEWVKRIRERIIDIFVDRSKGAEPEKPLTRASIKKNWDRRDWWLSSDECLKYGIVDEVL